MAKESYYKDVREHLKALEERGKLIRVKKRINKDTELMPLVRWQFRGLEESQRKAFLFQNVTDVKGKSYSMPVTVGNLAVSTEINSIVLMGKPGEIQNTKRTKVRYFVCWFIYFVWLFPALQVL